MGMGIGMRMMWKKKEGKEEEKAGKWGEGGGVNGI